MTLPYVRGVSENIKRMLEKVNVRVRMKPHRTLRPMLIKPKDPTLNHHQIWVVYWIVNRIIHVYRAIRTLLTVQDEGTQTSSRTRQH